MTVSNPLYSNTTSRTISTSESSSTHGSLGGMSVTTDPADHRESRRRASPMRKAQAAIDEVVEKTGFNSDEKSSLIASLNEELDEIVGAKDSSGSNAPISTRLREFIEDLDVDKQTRLHARCYATRHPKLCAGDKELNVYLQEASLSELRSFLNREPIPKTASKADLPKLESIALEVKPASQLAPDSKAGTFYVEDQRDQSCGRHAINAMLGGPVVSDRSFTAYAMYKQLDTDLKNRSEAIQERASGMQDGLVTSGVPVEEAIQSKEDELQGELRRHDLSVNRADLNVASGTESQDILDYLNFLFDRQILQHKYGCYSIDLTGKSTSSRMMRVVPNKIDADSCIVSTDDPKHHVAFRKDANGNWYLLDSLENSREPKMQTPQDYIEDRKTKSGANVAAIIFPETQQR